MTKSFDGILNEVERMDDERYDAFLTKLANRLDSRHEVADREVEGAVEDGDVPAISMSEDEWAVDALQEQMLYGAVVDSLSGDQEEFVESIREFRDQVDAQTYSNAAGGIEEYVEEVFTYPLEETRGL